MRPPEINGSRPPKPASGRSFLGIDGGGSGVRAGVLDLDSGSFDVCEQDTPADFSSGSDEAVLDALEKVGKGALRRHGRMADVAFAGVAGCVSAEQRESVEARLISAGVASSVVVHHDAYATWFGATGGEPGVIVIAGTGSSVFTVDMAGRELLVGGFGAVLGDEGGGADLGREALRAAAAAEDGYGRARRVRDVVLEALGLDSMREAMSMGQSSEAAWLARLAQPLLGLVGVGDRDALAILQARVGCLADQIVVALDACGAVEPPPVFGAGSLFLNASYLHEIRSAVQQRRPGADLRRCPRSPLAGAVLAAVAQAEGPGTETMHRALELLAAS